MLCQVHPRTSFADVVSGDTLSHETAIRGRVSQMLFLHVLNWGLLLMCQSKIGAGLFLQIAIHPRSIAAEYSGK